MSNDQVIAAGAFQLLFEASPHPYLILRPDAKLTIIAVNDRYLAATQTRRDDIVGRGLFEVFPDNPDDHSGSGVSDLRTSLERVMHDRVQDIMGVQKYDIPRRDGGSGFELKYWSPVNTPVIDTDGHIAFIIHHVEDVTDFIAVRESANRAQKVEARAERMEAEVLRRATEVKDANRRLKTAMEELERRGAELGRLNERLKDLDRAKTEFFSNVSHEFRTPLTLMLGPLEEALGSQAIPPDNRAALEMAYRNALRLLKLVNTLLDFSRIEAGRAKPDWHHTDLAAFTAQLASNFHSACERAGLQLVIDCPALPQSVEIDRGMWEKIVLNLVSNAFKFTLSGRIEVRLRAVDADAELTISDTGCGIPQDEIPHLFERFHRVKSARGRTFEGTGIGLALVDELVRIHGGSIGVESSEGHGSSFKVRVPLHAARAAALTGEGVAARRADVASLAPAFVEEALSWLPGAATAVPAPGKNQAAANARILVADDNADMRTYIRRLLETAGYEVQAVADGAAALRACRDQPPDLLLSDVMMPDLDGFALLKHLRGDLRSAHLPVILLSARVDDVARAEAAASGADDYLIKPFHSQELVIRVDGAIRLARQRHEAAEKMARLAYHDALTDLPNRALFGDRLEKALEHANRNGRPVGLLMIDLDRFKNINDTLGHAAGDRLLVIAAARVRQCVREEDTVARLGGDEFGVLLNEIAHAQDAALIAGKIIAVLVEPVALEGKQVVTSASIGISIYPADAQGAEDLVRAADAAMYRAKERGRNTFEFYTSQLTAETREKLSLEMDLRQAQAKGELMVYYQPQIELRSGRIAGVEALLRWRHSTRGLVPPDRFIPVAEESGLIGPIGDWVMHQAIAQQQDWMAQGLAPVRMAVNLSGRQILFSNVVESVDRALRACALSEEQIDLEFEVTESTLLESDRCADALRRLSARGISIAIDDFGTGFSSLAHLKHLPIDTLKIAKLFIRQIPSDADDSAIVSTIIAIGHNLRLRVVGEGVETQEQLAFLRTQGCDEVQGFLFSKAINADEMTQLLHRSSAASTAPEAETS